MTSPDQLRIVSVNTLNGGTDANGSTARRDRIAGALTARQPDIVLVQEFTAPDRDLDRRWRALAAAAGLAPAALGPPRGEKLLRCGILVNGSRIDVMSAGPPEYPDAPRWSEADLLIRETGTEITAVSVHLSASNAVDQLKEAQRLGNRVVRRGRISVIGGDMNCYARNDPTMNTAVLARLSPHLWTARGRIGHGGTLTGVNYDVDDTFTALGIIDPVPLLDRDRREPPDPVGTGNHPEGVIDRCGVFPEEAASVVESYLQRRVDGTDHAMFEINMGLSNLAAVAAPGHRK